MIDWLIDLFTVTTKERYNRAIYGLHKTLLAFLASVYLECYPLPSTTCFIISSTNVRLYGFAIRISTDLHLLIFHFHPTTIHHFDLNGPWHLTFLTQNIFVSLREPPLPFSIITLTFIVTLIFVLCIHPLIAFIMIKCQCTQHVVPSQLPKCNLCVLKANPYSLSLLINRPFDFIPIFSN